ncbi:protein kinase domain-containing protein [Trichocoleus sp. FACHB-262]|uniref:serine/threonine-protein kinase n=1 Tax=Trichocoleus sp. FACHB-262 TaxID=2692869 RepID=UPI0016848094|nr:protein kinase [Trichocoleus sp. FACHB-262]MBD2122701.1 serine/threonine protein kinase [Trichocoleus sp. FACHB-262]
MSNRLARPDPPASQPLKRSKYRLLGLVGQGQFGRVFCASHRKTGRLVALKELDHQRFPTHKFLRELRFLLSLQHANIVTCQALEHTRRGRYLVMDYCEGGTLRSLMEGAAPLTLAQGLKLMLDILAGLSHAHQRSIVHCDIKPENILLNTQPRGWTARISDFGIARLSRELAQEAGNTGSPAYMAPERFYGQYFLSSDLYALGILFFELLLGYRPFSGSPVELMSAHLNSPVNIPEVVPAELSQVALTALQKLPARRFQTAEEMLAATQSAVEELSARLPLESIHLPLLPPPHSSTPQCAFHSVEHEPLIASMASLAVMASPAGQWLYRSTDLVCNGEIIADQLMSTPTIPLAIQKQRVGAIAVPERIQALVARPQGCFAIASRSIYLLPLDQAIPVASNDGRLLTRPLVQLDSEFVATIAPQGNWLATAAHQPEATATTITIWRHQLGQPDQEFVAQAAIEHQSASSCQILALDSRHLAVMSTLGDNSTESFSTGVLSSSSKPLSGSGQSGLSPGTLIVGYTRRGQRLGSWLLPLAVDSLISSAIPYRVLGKEAGCTDSMVLIDLKPLRVRRIRVNLEPAIFVATAWGYVLADRQGQLVLLDEEGQQLGQIAAPTVTSADSPTLATAIATFSNFGVLLATWQQATQQGHIHTIDLREFDLDLMF